MSEQRTTEQRSTVQKEFEAVLKAYFRAGQSNNGACFDPYGGYIMQEARDKATAFLKKIVEHWHD